MVKPAKCLAVVLAALLAVFLHGPGFAQNVDIELVLAVDGSGSVNQREFGLQLGGISSAFVEPEIINAITSGPNGKIAVALVIWSDALYPKKFSKWHILDGRPSAQHFAREVLTFHDDPDRFLAREGSGTSIGDRIKFAVKMIEDNSIIGIRKVIDVSGDGEETRQLPQIMNVSSARALALSKDFTINGLAILNDFPHLDTWYRQNVIAGPGAFVMQAADFSDFQRAFLNKLSRELTHSIADARQIEMQHVRRVVVSGSFTE